MSRISSFQKNKKRKWNDYFIKYGVFHPKSEESSRKLSTPYMLSNSNQCLAASKLQSHLQRNTASIFVQTAKFSLVISHK